MSSALRTSFPVMTPLFVVFEDVVVFVVVVVVVFDPVVAVVAAGVGWGTVAAGVTAGEPAPVRTHPHAPVLITRHSASTGATQRPPSE